MKISILIYMNYDNIINKIFWKENELMNAHSRVVKLNKHPNIKKYLLCRYEDSNNVLENLFRIHYSIEERPKCKYCGNPTKFVGRKTIIYQEYCCNKCAAKGENRGKKWYEKQKEYNIQKYGIKNNFDLPWIKKEKMRAKIRKTCLEKYGVTCNLISQESIDKMIETKRKNHTFNTSKPEEDLYEYIKLKFPNIIRQYKDKERYPFACDFYIPELDYFIELNGMWTHGRHPYNEYSTEDIDILKEWKLKAKTSNFYKCAIKTWTISDPKKREIAKINKLNYKEVWDLNEGKTFIDKLYNNL